MEKVDVILSCHNEAKSIGKVLKVLSSSRFVKKIIFVDDGNIDESAQIASQFNKTEIIKFPRPLGKGKAVKKAYKFVTTRGVFLCDSDIKGLRTTHIKKLINVYLKNPDSLVIGNLRSNNNKFKFWLLTRITPTMDGERIISKENLGKVLKSKNSQGYGLEPWMNYYFKKNNKKTYVVPLVGVFEGKQIRKGVKRIGREIKDVALTYYRIYKDILGIKSTPEAFLPRS